MSGKGFFRNAQGEKSSMRLIWAFISITVISVWAIISIHNWKVEPIGYELASLLVLLSGSKVAQTMVEKGDLSLKIGGKIDPATGELIKALTKSREPIKSSKEVEVK